MESLRDLAVLMSLSMSAYSPRKIDKKKSREITQANGAKDGSGKFIVDTLAGTTAGEVLGQIIKAQGEMRNNLFYPRTLRWDDAGKRMAATDAAYDLLEKLGPPKDRILRLADAFADAWVDAGTEARTVLNGLWKAEDYSLSQEEMRSKFDVRIDIEPMPEARDLRMDAPDAVLARIREQAEAHITAKFQAGCKDAYERLYKAIEHMHTTLSDPEQNGFHNTIIGNIRELIELLPILNIGKDPELDRIGIAARDKLLKLNVPPQFAHMEPSDKILTMALKENPQHRRDTARAASDILADMRLCMGGKQ